MGSKFYGQVKGRGKNNATQCGTLASGLRASAQSYDGSIAIELNYEGDELRVKVDWSPDSKFYHVDMKTLFDGPFDEFIRRFDGG